MTLEFVGRDPGQLVLAHDVHVEPFTGRATVSIPIPTTPGRGGFGPALTLMHGAGGGSSPFGLGVSLAGLPAIAIDTGRGTPRYDGTDALTFGGEEIVPALREIAGARVPLTYDVDADHDVAVFRRRRSGSGMRIERWTRRADGRVHWRSRDATNTVAIYGLDAGGKSRLFDPAAPERVAMWLPERWISATGELLELEYAVEDDAGIDRRLAFERGRGAPAQRYLKRVRWGNTLPAIDDALPSGGRFSFELVFDYGDHSVATAASNQAWPVRPDPSSTFRNGFEVRTYRLCRRILMFHAIPELGDEPVLVGMTALEHDLTLGAARLRTIVHTGVRRELDGTVVTKALPPLALDYGADTIADGFIAAPRETAENLPAGLAGRHAHLVDLFGDGLPGVLVESERAWHYKPNEGDGRFGSMVLVAERPSARRGAFGFGDPDADGNTDLVQFGGRHAGGWQLDRDHQRWGEFRPFERVPHVEAHAAHTRWVDLDGDGRADLVVSRHDTLVWYPSSGDRVLGDPIELAFPSDPGAAPTLTDDLDNELLFADLDGDGRPDLVRVSRGGIEYWPQLGHGRFGTRIVLEAPPGFTDDDFDPRRVRFADLRGVGMPDLLYVGLGELRVFRNEAGNRFVEAAPIRGLPFIDNLASIQIVDFLGDGRPCLVWSNGLPGTTSPMQYLPLADACRPTRIVRVGNGRGGEIALSYRSSAVDYHRDRDRGEPWRTRLPAHGTVVAERRVRDALAGTEEVTRYAYRDGFFDSREREMRGFARVDVLDGAASVADAADAIPAAPRLTRLWYHVGASDWLTGGVIGAHGSNLPRVMACDVVADAPLTGDELADGMVSLTGRTIRREIYAAVLDNSSLGATPALHPLRIEAWGLRAIRRQAAAPGDIDARTTVWSAIEHEHLSIMLEGAPADPRVTRSVALIVDERDVVVQNADIAYGRTGPADIAAQAKTRIVVGEQRVAHRDEPAHLQLAVPIESRSYEIGGLDANQLDSPTLAQTLAAALPHDAPAPGVGVWARLIDLDRFYYWDDAGADVLPLGEVGTGLEHHREEACFSPAFAAASLPGVTPAKLVDAGYVLADSLYWRRDPIQIYGAFGQIEAVERSDGATFRHTWDAHRLAVIAIEDPLGNKQLAELDYHVIAPWQLRDANDAVEEVAYDPLGVIVRATRYAVLGAQPYGQEPLASYTPTAPASPADLIASPSAHLQRLSRVVAYDLEAYTRDGVATTMVALSADVHVHDGRGGIEPAPIARVAISYLDGSGRTMQEKLRVEPGPAVQRTVGGGVIVDAQGVPVLAPTTARWLATGNIRYDAQGRPARVFEPFFSPTWQHENDVELAHYGSPTLELRDPLGRVVAEHHGDGALARTEYGAWTVTRLDANDLVDAGTWALTRDGLPLDDPDRLALDHARSLAGTGTTTFLDATGAELGQLAPGGASAESQSTEVRRDASGAERELVDARGLIALRWTRDMLGHPVVVESVDGGTTRTFVDACGRALSAWDPRGIVTDTSYDLLDRVTAIHASGGGLDHRVEERIYGEALNESEARARALRGRIVVIRDGAGELEIDQADPIHDVALRSTRRLLVDIDAPPDWRTAVALEPEAFVTERTVDTAGRPVRERFPDGMIRISEYQIAGHTGRITVEAEDGSIPPTVILETADDDAHGRRVAARLGNGAELAHRYDPLSLRLVGTTVRTHAGTRLVQDLRYTHDASGLLVSIADAAQEPGATGVLTGLAVSARRDFTYDAHRRLVRATGRVHQAYLPGDAFTEAGTSHLHPNNGAAVERYVRTFTYDRGNNLTRIQHSGPTIQLATDLWTSTTSNRGLPQTTPPLVDPETRFDAAGNTRWLPHLRRLDWDWSGRLARAVIIDREGQGPDDAELYVYGADGMRVRRVTQRVVAGELEITDKIYLGACERLRVRRGANVLRERWSSRVIADGDAIATIDRETIGGDSAPLVVYPIGDHQRSPTLELDATGLVLRYEEHFPYGGSAFIAAGDAASATRKERRYMAKERDAATGLHDFGHRVYASWLGRWLSPDPIGPEDDINLYRFVSGDPIGNVDLDGLEGHGTGQMTGRKVPMPEIPPPKEAPSAGNVWGWNPDQAEWQQHTTGEWQGIAKAQGFDIGYIDARSRDQQIHDVIGGMNVLADTLKAGNEAPNKAWGDDGDPNGAAGAPDASKKPASPGQPGPGGSGPGGAGGPGTGGNGLKVGGSKPGAPGGPGAPGEGKQPGGGEGKGVGNARGDGSGPKGATGAKPGAGDKPGGNGTSKQGAPEGNKAGKPDGKGKEPGTGKGKGTEPGGKGKGPGGSARGVEGGTGTGGGGIGDGTGAVGDPAKSPSSPYAGSVGSTDGAWDGTNPGSGITIRNPNGGTKNDGSYGAPPKSGKQAEESSTGETIARELAGIGGILNLELPEEVEDGHKYGVPGGGNPNGIKSPVAQGIFGAVSVVAAVFSAGAGGAAKSGAKSLTKKGAGVFVRMAQALKKMPVFGKALRRIGRGLPLIGRTAKAYKNVLRQHARALWQGAHRVKLPPWIQVHHRIPLEYSHLFKVNPNRLKNLMAVDVIGHARIHMQWSLSKVMGPMSKGINAQTVEATANAIDASLRANGIRRLLIF